MHTEHTEVSWCAEKCKSGAHDEGALLLLEQLDGTAPDFGRLCLEAPQLPLVRLHPALPCTCTHMFASRHWLRTPHAIELLQVFQPSGARCA